MGLTTRKEELWQIKERQEQRREYHPGPSGTVVLLSARDEAEADLERVITIAEEQLNRFLQPVYVKLVEMFGEAVGDDEPDIPTRCVERALQDLQTLYEVLDQTLYEVLDWRDE